MYRALIKECHHIISCVFLTIPHCLGNCNMYACMTHAMYVYIRWKVMLLLFWWVILSLVCVSWCNCCDDGEGGQGEGDDVQVGLYGVWELRARVESAQWASRWTKLLGNQIPQTRSASGGVDWLAMGRPWIFVWHPWQPHRALRSPSKWPKTTKNGHFRHF